MTDETTEPRDAAQTPDAPPAPEPSARELPATPPPASPEASLLATAEPSALPALRSSEGRTSEGSAAEGAVEYGEFTLPEGMSVDTDALAQARALFSEARLPQEQAQKFIDLAVSRERAAAEAGARAFVELQNKWVSEIKADPDIGGARLNASLAAAARAIDRLAVPGLKEALTLTGAGNNPAVVKAFVRLGQMISEDRFAPGHAAAPAVPRSPAERIYDGNPKQ
jgi:hypothetical protein